jgi:hypothetical protein
MHTIPPLARLRARQHPAPPTRWLPTFLVLGLLWLLVEVASRF